MIELIGGVLYGLLVGLIPTAGATTGLIILFSFLYIFPDPYSALIFIMAVVAASTTADTFSSVLLGIPGANSSAATIQDGYPLAQKGKASFALSSAITSSTSLLHLPQIPYMNLEESSHSSQMGQHKPPIDSI